MNHDRIGFAWGVSSYHGWGVIGLNVMLHWPGEALCLMPEMTAELGPEDDRRFKLYERIAQSMRLQRDAFEHRKMVVGGPMQPVWVALGNDFDQHEMPWPIDERYAIAFPVFENLAIAVRNVPRLEYYANVITASRWNQEFLRAHGVDAKLCHQGFDPVLFHPGVRRKRDDGRFRVFSGGKCEWRKGQDLVLQAFARFAEKHDDAVLVAAWGSPWPGLARNFLAHDIQPPPGSSIDRPNFRAWADRFGIKPHQIEIVPPLPNWRMPEVYAEVDCALFPNRFEGGTNLVAMEAMACGIPSIVMNVAGQVDLPIDAIAWLVPDESMAHSPSGVIETLVLGLERVYQGGIAPLPLGLDWSWPNRLAELQDILGSG